MEGIHSYFIHERKQDRGQNDEGSGGFHECPHDKQDDIDKQEYGNAVMGYINDRLGDILRNLLAGQEPRENTRGPDDQHNQRACYCGIYYYFWQ